MPNAREQRRMLAVSLGARTMSEALAALRKIAAAADIVELRLDFFEEPYDLPRLLNDRPLPVIVTNRPPREGGRCNAPESERLTSLRRAAELGAEYVDVEWDAASPNVLGPIKDAGSKVLVSRHSFVEMPADFVDWADLMVERGADVVKIVGMARDVRDTLPVFEVLARADRPTVAIAMGEAGLPSRVLALRYDTCFLTYATLGTGEKVAPGQLPIAELHEVYQADHLTPDTTVFGLLGPSEDNDLATELNRGFVAASVNAVAVPFPATRDATKVMASFRALPVAGWYLTDPSIQEDVGQSLATLGPGARVEGKVNCVMLRDGELEGDWVATFAELVEAWTADRS